MNNYKYFNVRNIEEFLKGLRNHSELGVIGRARLIWGVTDSIKLKSVER